MVSEIGIGFSEMLSLAQTIGIVGTMVLTLYFSKKQIQSLSIDTQTRGLNDLGEKYLKIVERAMEDPSIQGVIDNEIKLSREGAYSFYILWICSHAYAMRKRNVLDDNEWVGWLQWMRHIFQRGTIKETWKQIEPDKWFNTAFQDFVNREIVVAIAAAAAAIFLAAALSFTAGAVSNISHGFRTAIQSHKGVRDKG